MAVSTTARRSRTRDAAAALKAARTSAAIRCALNGQRLDEADAHTLEAFRQSVHDAAAAARFGTTSTARPTTARRQLASVGLALGAARHRVAPQNTSGRAIAESLERVERDVSSLLEGKRVSDPSTLTDFVNEFVALSARRSASAGDTVLRSA